MDNLTIYIAIILGGLGIISYILNVYKGITKPDNIQDLDIAMIKVDIANIKENLGNDVEHLKKDMREVRENIVEIKTVLKDKLK